MQIGSKPLVNVVRVIAEAHAAQERLHGWEIMKRTGHAGPTIYGVIDRLEDAEWIEGEFEELPPDVSRPRRRYYRLTAKGQEKAPLLLELQEEFS